MEFVNKNFSTLLITALVLFLYMKGVFDKNPQQAPTIVVVSDTTNKNHTATVVSYPGQTQYIPYPIEKITREMVLDTAYMHAILQDYLSTKVQEDSLKIDSIGSIHTTTFTSRNKVDSTWWKYNIKEREIKTTITVKEPYKPKTELYYGFGITSPIGPLLGIQQAEASLLLKNKKDNILRLSPGYNFPLNTPTLSLGYYKKF
jgi:hypothetical protein